MSSSSVEFIWQRKNHNNCVTMYWHLFPVNSKKGDHPVCGHKKIKFLTVGFENSQTPDTKCQRCEKRGRWIADGRLKSS